jgi:hypothetical protein
MMRNHRIGATSGCTLRVMEDTVGENHHFNGMIGDAWLGLTWTVNELSKAGFEGIFQIKQYAALFPKKYIEKALEDAPGGVSFIFTGVHPSGEKIVAVSYWYNYA